MDLTIDAISVTLGKRTVLREISAVLRAGHVTAILGPNGAGKSTLVKAMAGLIAPNAGAIRLGEAAIAALDPRARARAIGYLPQEAVVHWNIVAGDVVALGRLPHRGHHAALSPADHAAIRTAMIATETTGFANRPIRELSGGERARVLLARVLAGEPEWLIADEPLSSLDPAHQIDILDRLRDAAVAGAGVVIVLHDLAHAARIADDVLLLDDGRVVGFGSVAETLTPESIAAVFGITARWIESDGTRLLVPIGR